jgi:serine/threonine protein kinase
MEVEPPKPINQRVSAIYIGTETPEERKRIFLEYFSITPPIEEPVGPIHQVISHRENPYKEDSWYKEENIRLLEKFPHMEELRDSFQNRYGIVNQIIPKNQSITKPLLFNIVSLTNYFKHILYEREDLFMKLVPLTDLNDYSLEEIYNEVKIAYFLNELVYGYTGVLSLHFMTIVDWFTVPRIISLNGGMVSYHQAIISEKIDILLEDYLYANPSIEVLRIVLFQLFHALETAWCTNQYTHNDLHLGNLMLKIITPDSPLFGKDFLYRRLSNPYWYRLPSSVMNNKLLKIIDFGRNRCWVPKEEHHLSIKIPGRHNHNRLIYLPHMRALGNLKESANRRIDIICPLLHILALNSGYWNNMGGDELDSFYDLCEKAISWETINENVALFVDDDIGFDKKEIERQNGCIREFDAVNRRVTVRNYKDCPWIHSYMKQPKVYIYAYAEMDFPLQKVLDHPFLAHFMIKGRIDEDLPREPKTFLQEERNLAIVSFVQHHEEGYMTFDSSIGCVGGGALSCSVCKKRGIEKVLGNELYCGEACFEFKNYFNSKTVFR